MKLNLKRKRFVIASIIVGTLLVALFGLTVFRWRDDRERRTIVYELSRKSYSSNPEEGAAATKSLREMGPKAVTELIDLLHAKDQRWKLAVWSAASRLPSEYRAIVYRQLPIRYAGTSRMFASRGLGLLGTNAAPAVPALAEALRSTNNNVCWFAAEALGRAGPQALDPLVAASGSPVDYVRYVALFGLSGMRSNGLAAYPAIEKCFADKADYVRNSAFQAARNLGPEAIPLLTNSLVHHDPLVRRGARQTLGLFSRAAQDAVPVIISRTAEMEPEELAHSIKTVRKIWVMDPATVKWLVNLAGHKDTHVQLAALQALVTAGGLARPYAESLRKHLDSEDPNVRKAADFLVRILDAQPISSF